MLLGLVEITEEYFVGKNFYGKYIKVKNFSLDKDIKVGSLIEIDLKGLDYEVMDYFDMVRREFNGK